MKKVTAKEIAQVARVSTATVSRIMSGHGGHRFSTVKKVENAARELGIKLNLFCPGTDCVGIITHAAYDFNCTPYSTALLSSAHGFSTGNALKFFKKHSGSSLKITPGFRSP